MQAKYLPANYDDHDKAAAALFDTMSLDALSFLINHGRELEFTVQNNELFLSCSGSKDYVSLWCNGKEDCFPSMDSLLHTATINGIPFLQVWNNAELQYLL